MNGTLTLNPILKEHEGVFICEVDNEVGERLEKKANVVVHGKHMTLLFSSFTVHIDF